MKVVGVDIGGTKISAALIAEDKIVQQCSCPTPNDDDVTVVIKAIEGCITEVFAKGVVGIGVGIPGLIDLKNNLVINVVNIPSWNTVPLKQLIEKKFDKSVFINNDANCFALGEKYFGKAKNYENFVGITLGTGLGAGIVINNQLYSGNFCGAGEFGMLYYRDKNIEHYASGQFFKSYNLSGDEIARKAKEGEKAYLDIFHDFGVHVGHAIANILYCLAPDAIILGGSVSRSYPYFEEGMKSVLEDDFIFQQVYKALRIEISEMENSALFGACSLVMNNLLK